MFIIPLPKTLPTKLLPISLKTSPSPTTNLQIYRLWTFHINGIIQYVYFCDLLLWFNMFSKFIHVLVLPFFVIIFHYVVIPHFNFAFISWWAFGVFPLFMDNATMSTHINFFVWTYVRFWFFMAALLAYGSSRARGWIWAAAATCAAAVAMPDRLTHCAGL